MYLVELHIYCKMIHGPYNIKFKKKKLFIILLLSDDEKQPLAHRLVNHRKENCAV